MTYTLEALRSEYLNLAATVEIRPQDVGRANATANRLLRGLARYQSLERFTGVPAVVIMCIHERESGGNWNTYLGNGQPLDRVTTIEPKGRGPFATFEDGAVDAFRLLGVQPQLWGVAELCYWMEKFNGFGYRQYHNMRSPYVWGGTNHQQIGKYVSDGHFDGTTWDTQLGGMAVYKAITALVPSLALRGQATTPAPIPVPRPTPVPTAPPSGGGWWDAIKAVLRSFGVSI